jgi:hypothetical protein
LRIRPDQLLILAGVVKPAKHIFDEAALALWCLVNHPFLLSSCGPVRTRRTRSR